MISKSVADAMNEQINKEMYSSYLYLAMSAYFIDQNLAGFANWMRVQAGEELEHAMKFYDYLQDRGAQVVLKAIAQPPVEFSGPLAIFEQSYAHEQKVTASINDIYALAVKESDFASQVFLNWFVNEQVEEEKNASEIVALLKMIGDKSNAIFQLDHRLGKRGGED